MPLAFRSSRRPSGGVPGSSGNSATGATVGFAGVAAAAAFAFAVHKAARLRSPVGPSQWKSTLTDDGSVKDFEELLQQIAEKGLEPSLRLEVWPLLLGVFGPEETVVHRAESYGQLRRAYEALLQRCRELEAGCLTATSARRYAQPAVGASTGAANTSALPAALPSAGPATALASASSISSISISTSGNSSPFAEVAAAAAAAAEPADEGGGPGLNPDAPPDPFGGLPHSSFGLSADPACPSTVFSDPVAQTDHRSAHYQVATCAISASDPFADVSDQGRPSGSQQGQCGPAGSTDGAAGQEGASAVLSQADIVQAATTAAAAPWSASGREAVRALIASAVLTDDDDDDDDDDEDEDDEAVDEERCDQVVSGGNTDGSGIGDGCSIERPSAGYAFAVFPREPSSCVMLGRVSRGDLPADLRPYWEAQQSIAMDAIRVDFAKLNIPGVAAAVAEAAAALGGGGAGAGGLLKGLGFGRLSSSSSGVSGLGVSGGQAAAVAAAAAAGAAAAAATVAVTVTGETASVDGPAGGATTSGAGSCVGGVGGGEGGGGSLATRLKVLSFSGASNASASGGCAARTNGIAVAAAAAALPPPAVGGTVEAAAAAAAGSSLEAGGCDGAAGETTGAGGGSLALSLRGLGFGRVSAGSRFGSCSQVPLPGDCDPAGAPAGGGGSAEGLSAEREASVASGDGAGAEGGRGSALMRLKVLSFGGSGGNSSIVGGVRAASAATAAATPAEAPAPGEPHAQGDAGGGGGMAAGVGEVSGASSSSTGGALAMGLRSLGFGRISAGSSRLLSGPVTGTAATAAGAGAPAEGQSGGEAAAAGAGTGSSGGGGGGGGAGGGSSSGAGEGFSSLAMRLKVLSFNGGSGGAGGSPGGSAPSAGAAVPTHGAVAADGPLSPPLAAAAAGSTGSGSSSRLGSWLRERVESYQASRVARQGPAEGLLQQQQQQASLSNDPRDVASPLTSPRLEELRQQVPPPPPHHHHHQQQQQQQQSQDAAREEGQLALGVRAPLDEAAVCNELATQVQQLYDGGDVLLQLPEGQDPQLPDELQVAHGTAPFGTHGSSVGTPALLPAGDLGPLSPDSREAPYGSHAAARVPSSSTGNPLGSPGVLPRVGGLAGAPPLPSPVPPSPPCTPPVAPTTSSTAAAGAPQHVPTPPSGDSPAWYKRLGSSLAARLPPQPPRASAVASPPASTPSPSPAWERPAVAHSAAAASSAVGRSSLPDLNLFSFRSRSESCGGGGGGGGGAGAPLAAATPCHPVPSAGCLSRQDEEPARLQPPPEPRVKSRSEAAEAEAEGPVASPVPSRPLPRCAGQSYPLSSSPSSSPGSCSSLSEGEAAAASDAVVAALPAVATAAGGGAASHGGDASAADAFAASGGGGDGGGGNSRAGGGGGGGVWLGSVARYHLDHAAHFTAAQRRQVERLVVLLSAYAAQDPVLGYCQGMSDLALPFVLLFEDDVMAFWCFAGLVSKVRANFLPRADGVFERLATLGSLLAALDPPLGSHLGLLGADHCHFAHRMVAVQLRRELPGELAVRLWEQLWADDLLEALAARREAEWREAARRRTAEEQAVELTDMGGLWRRGLGPRGNEAEVTAAGAEATEAAVEAGAGIQQVVCCEGEGKTPIARGASCPHGDERGCKDRPVAGPRSSVGAAAVGDSEASGAACSEAAVVAPMPPSPTASSLESAIGPLLVQRGDRAPEPYRQSSEQAGAEGGPGSEAQTVEAAGPNAAAAAAPTDVPAQATALVSGEVGVTEGRVEEQGEVEVAVEACPLGGGGGANSGVGVDAVSSSGGVCVVGQQVADVIVASGGNATAAAAAAAPAAAAGAASAEPARPAPPAARMGPFLRWWNSRDPSSPPSASEPTAAAPCARADQHQPPTIITSATTTSSANPTNTTTHATNTSVTRIDAGLRPADDSLEASAALFPPPEATAAIEAAAAATAAATAAAGSGMERCGQEEEGAAGVQGAMEEFGVGACEHGATNATLDAASSASVVAVPPAAGSAPAATVPAAAAAAAVAPAPEGRIARFLQFASGVLKGSSAADAAVAEAGASGGTAPGSPAPNDPPDTAAAAAASATAAPDSSAVVSGVGGSAAVAAGERKLAAYPLIDDAADRAVVGPVGTAAAATDATANATNRITAGATDIKACPTSPDVTASATASTSSACEAPAGPGVPPSAEAVACGLPAAAAAAAPPPEGRIARFLQFASGVLKGSSSAADAAVAEAAVSGGTAAAAHSSAGTVSDCGRDVAAVVTVTAAADAPNDVAGGSVLAAGTGGDSAMAPGGALGVPDGVPDSCQNTDGPETDAAAAPIAAAAPRDAVATSASGSGISAADAAETTASGSAEAVAGCLQAPAATPLSTAAAAQSGPEDALATGMAACEQPAAATGTTTTTVTTTATTTAGVPAAGSAAPGAVTTQDSAAVAAVSDPPGVCISSSGSLAVETAVAEGSAAKGATSSEPTAKAEPVAVAEESPTESSNPSPGSPRFSRELFQFVVAAVVLSQRRRLLDCQELDDVLRLFQSLPPLGRSDVAEALLRAREYRERVAPRAPTAVPPAPALPPAPSAPTAAAAEPPTSRSGSLTMSVGALRRWSGPLNPPAPKL